MDAVLHQRGAKASYDAGNTHPSVIFAAGLCQWLPVCKVAGSTLSAARPASFFEQGQA
jgi:hypothetical protein